MPTYRPGLGDDTERYVVLPGGSIEYRFTPGYGCEIVNIQVDNDKRRTGVGRELVRKLVDHVGDRAKCVYAITRTSNRIAQEFYRGVGFRLAGTFIDFYPDNDPGACVFVKRIHRD